MNDVGPGANCGPETTVSYWLNRASRLLVRFADARLRPLGLAMSHLPVLRTLADGAPCSQTELARRAGVEQPSMAETLARMVRDGVLTRRPNPADGRSMLFALTLGSRVRFPKAAAALREAEHAALAALSEDERELLRMLLKRVVVTLEERAAADDLSNSRSSGRRDPRSTSPQTPARRR
jgi:DNA-binding MarR family transcriptional regulator